MQERKEEGQRVVVVVVLSSDEAATQATQPDTMMTMTRQLLAAITRSDGDKQRLANQPHGSETYLPIKRRGLKEESTYKAITREREREPQEEHTHAERRREGEGALRQHSGARGRRPTTKEPKLLLLLFVSLSLAPLPSSSSAAVVGEQKHTAHKSAKIGAIFRYIVPRYSFPSLLPLVVRLVWFGWFCCSGCSLISLGL